jgi:hypothetical protein
MNEQKRPGWAFWFVAAVSAPLCYVLSLGPSCWLSARYGGEKVVTLAYRPLTAIAERANSRHLDTLICRYSELGAAGQWRWMSFTEAPGDVKWRWENSDLYSRSARLRAKLAARRF